MLMYLINIDKWTSLGLGKPRILGRAKRLGDGVFFGVWKYGRRPH